MLFKNKSFKNYLKFQRKEEEEEKTCFYLLN
jgi:hypothetical protein